MKLDAMNLWIQLDSREYETGRHDKAKYVFEVEHVRPGAKCKTVFYLVAM